LYLKFTPISNSYKTCNITALKILLKPCTGQRNTKHSQVTLICT